VRTDHNFEVARETKRPNTNLDLFVGHAYQGRHIVLKTIIEYSSFQGTLAPTITLGCFLSNNLIIHFLTNVR
jgi:hypothetical protein